MGKGQSKSHIVIFVEGDTDQIFFEGLLEYYRNHSSTPVHSCGNVVRIPLAKAAPRRHIQ